MIIFKYVMQNIEKFIWIWLPTIFRNCNKYILISIMLCKIQLSIDIIFFFVKSVT